MLAKESIRTSVVFLQTRPAKSAPMHFRASPTVVGVPESPEARRDQTKILFVRCYNNPLVTGYVRRKARNRRHLTGQDLLIERQKQRRHRAEQRLEKVEGWSADMRGKENLLQDPTRRSAIQEMEPLRDSIPLTLGAGTSTFPNTEQTALTSNGHGIDMECQDKDKRGFCAVNFGITKEGVKSHFPSLLQNLIVDMEERHDKGGPHRNYWHIYFETPKVMRFVLENAPQEWKQKNHGEGIHPHLCEIQMCPISCTKPNDRPSAHSAIDMAPALLTKVSEYIVAKSTRGLYIRNIASVEQIKNLFFANGGVKITEVQQELNLPGESNCWHVIFESVQSMENALQQLSDGPRAVIWPVDTRIGQTVLLPVGTPGSSESSGCTTRESYPPLLPKPVSSELQTIREVVPPHEKQACFIIRGVRTAEGVKGLFPPEDVSKIVEINEKLTQNGSHDWYLHFSSEEVRQDIQQRLLSKNIPGGKQLVQKVESVPGTQPLHSPITIEVLDESRGGHSQQPSATTVTPTHFHGTKTPGKSHVDTTSGASYASIDTGLKVECLETSERTAPDHSVGETPQHPGRKALETPRKSSPQISAWGPPPQDRPGRRESLTFSRGKQHKYFQHARRSPFPTAIPGRLSPYFHQQLATSHLGALPILPVQCGDLQQTQLFNLEEHSQTVLSLRTQLASKELETSRRSPVIPNISFTASTVHDLLNLDEDPLPVTFCGNIPLAQYPVTEGPTGGVSTLKHWEKELEGLDWPPSELPNQIMVFDDKCGLPQRGPDTSLGLESSVERVDGTNAQGYVFVGKSETQSTTLGNVELKAGFDAAQAPVTCNIVIGEPTGVDTETRRPIGEGVAIESESEVAPDSEAELFKPLSKAPEKPCATQTTLKTKDTEQQSSSGESGGDELEPVGGDEDCDWEDIPEKKRRGKGVGKHNGYGQVSTNLDHLRKVRRGRKTYASKRE